MQHHKHHYYWRYYKFYKRLGPVKGVLFRAWGLWLFCVVMSIVGGAVPEDQSWIKILGVGSGLWGGVLLGLGVRLWREKLFRDAVLLTSLTNLSGAVLLCGTGWSLIRQGGDIPLPWMRFLLLVLVAINWKHRYREVEQWEVARRKGYLKRHLDEKRWLIRYNLWDFAFLLSHAEGKEQEYVKRLRWTGRLDKLSPLIPGSAMLFRRAFGHEMTVIGVGLCVMGSVLMRQLQHLMLYFKIREWERERGAPLVVVRKNKA